MPAHLRQGAPLCRILSPDDGVHLDDGPLWIEAEDLVPLLGKGGAVVGVRHAALVEVCLEGLNVVRAVGDVTALDRVDRLLATKGDAEILLRQTARGERRAGRWRGTVRCVWRLASAYCICMAPSVVNRMGTSVPPRSPLAGVRGNIEMGISSMRITSR